MTKVFIVVKTGVFDHGVYGIEDTLEKAKEVAETWAAAEGDNYHDFDIRTNSPDQNVSHDNCPFGKDVCKLTNNAYTGANGWTTSDKRIWMVWVENGESGKWVEMSDD